MKNKDINLLVDGQEIKSNAGVSILDAMMQSGKAVTNNIGCLGQGACGACRVLIRRDGERDVKSALACETIVEDGLQVSFLDHIPMSRQHVYKTDDWENNSWHILRRINEVFPEAKNCRHCGGCDSACPKHLDVQKGVNMAAAGDLNAALIFDECIMCNLCTIACPEMISPNHLGTYIRRLTAATSLRPSDLMHRLHQIETGEMSVDTNVEIK